MTSIVSQNLFKYSIREKKKKKENTFKIIPTALSSLRNCSPQSSSLSTSAFCVASFLSGNRATVYRISLLIDHWNVSLIKLPSLHFLNSFLFFLSLLIPIISIKYQLTEQYKHSSSQSAYDRLSSLSTLCNQWYHHLHLWIYFEPSFQLTKYNRTKKKLFSFM